MLNMIKRYIKKYNNKKFNKKKEEEWFDRCMKELIYNN